MRIIFAKLSFSSQYLSNVYGNLWKYGSLGKYQPSICCSNPTKNNNNNNNKKPKKQRENNWSFCKLHFRAKDWRKIVSGESSADSDDATTRHFWYLSKTDFWNFAGNGFTCKYVNRLKKLSNCVLKIFPYKIGTTQKSIMRIVLFMILLKQTSD